MTATFDLSVWRGKTFQRTLRWEALPFVYKAIQNVTKAAPAVVECAGHGMPDGWRAAVVSVQGMIEINAKAAPPRPSDFHKGYVLDANHVELNDVNAAEFSAYEGGGYLQYYTPVELAGFTARMQIKDRAGGTVLASTDVDDAPLNIITVTVDNTTKAITVEIAAADTAAIAWRRGVYDLEMVSGAGVVTALLTGSVVVVDEVTTAT